MSKHHMLAVSALLAASSVSNTASAQYETDVVIQKVVDELIIAAEKGDMKKIQEIKKLIIDYRTEMREPSKDLLEGLENLSSQNK